MVSHAFFGTALHAPKPNQLELLKECLIVVDGHGRISGIRNLNAPGIAEEVQYFRSQGRLVELNRGEYVIPGLVDLHVHAPQWPQLGVALDVPLEEWLTKYTFPLEARYTDIEFARTIYEDLLRGLLANGTTTAVYFATIHLRATELLADICLRHGQRALIGRISMDNKDQCPEYYRDASAESAEIDTRSFIDYVQRIPGNSSALIRPVITPRFIPSCTEELLHRLGALVEETGCHVQTHCSESDWEHSYVLEHFGDTDAAILNKHGLLTRRTILAHSNFINDKDTTLIKGAGSAVAHCPLSNVYFAGAIFPLRNALDRGMHLGLGTDIAGGPSASVLESARHAAISSQILETGVDSSLPKRKRGRGAARISAIEAFWLATAGGGIALDLPIGIFAAGYQFDAVVIDTNTKNSNLRVEPENDANYLIQKIIYTASRQDVSSVWVAGRLVHEREKSPSLDQHCSVSAQNHIGS